MNDKTETKETNGIDDDEAAMHAAASITIFEMAEKLAEGGAK